MELLKLTAPIYLIVALGWWLRENELYTAEVERFMTFLTYRLLLPLSIFAKVSSARLDLTGETALFLSIQLALMVVVFWVYKPLLRNQAFEAFVNTVRGNNIYLGFPVMMQLLPAELLPLGMVLASVLSPVAIFGIEVLHRFQGSAATGTQHSLWSNPLVRALLLGIPFNLLGLWHPFLNELTGTLTKPLMFLSLLVVGANFSLRAFKQLSISPAMIAVLFGKLVVFPVLFYLAAVAFGFSREYLLVGVILFSTPGAATNYILVREMGYDSKLTINATLLGTAMYLLLLPGLSYITRIIAGL